MDKVDLKIFSIFVKDARSQLLTSLWAAIRKELEEAQKQSTASTNKQSESLLCPECDGSFFIISSVKHNWRKCFRCQHEWEV